MLIEADFLMFLFFVVFSLFKIYIITWRFCASCINAFFEGRLGCFSPKSYLSNRKLWLIRPLIYATEKDVKYFVSKRTLPVVTSLCPEDHATEREKMKNLLTELERTNKGVKHRIFNAMCKGEIDGFKLK